MSFKFSFSGDDIIDSDDEQTQDVKTPDEPAKGSANDESDMPSGKMDGIPPQLHTLESMVGLSECSTSRTIHVISKSSKYF